MIAKIHIEGVIATPDFEEGGTSLLDVITQVQQAKAQFGKTLTGFRVLINSPGGMVSEGDNIFNFIRSLAKEIEVVTQSNGEVSSIATKVWFATARRIMRAGDILMIHQPWTQTMGDATELEAQAEELREIEKQMVKFYAEHTNINTEGIASLMQNETIIDSTKAIELGFATEIAEPMKAMAMYNKNQKSINMDNFKELKSFLKNLTKGDIKNLDLVGEDGTTYFVDVETAEEAIGAQLMVVGPEGNAPAGEGSFTLEDGSSVVTDANSTITAINPAASEEEVEIAQLKSDLAERNEEVKNLSEQLAQFSSDDFKTKMLELTAQLEKAEATELEAVALKKELEGVKTKYNLKFGKEFKSNQKKEDDVVENRATVAMERRKNFKGNKSNKK